MNDVLQLSATKVDDFGTGAVYCQLLDSVYGDLPMHRVRFGSKTSLDVEQNYKILQQAFTRHKINRNIDSQRLMKCRLQDNLDFAQWIYAFWHENPHIPDYDPVARRANSGTPTRSATSSMRSRESMSDLSRQSSRVGSSIGARKDPSRISMASNPPSSPSFYQSTFTPQQRRQSSSGVLIADLQNRIKELEIEKSELIRSVDVLTGERGVYYDKLVYLEALVNEKLEEIYMFLGEDAGIRLSSDPLVVLIRQVQEILFSKPEGFLLHVSPEDEPF